MFSQKKKSKKNNQIICVIILQLKYTCYNNKMSCSLDLNDRVKALEEQIENLKAQKCGTDNSSDKKGKKEKKDKKPREPTQYNIFVSAFISKEKERLGESFNHKVAFGEAAKKWQEKKKV